MALVVVATVTEKKEALEAGLATGLVGAMVVVAGGKALEGASATAAVAAAASEVGVAAAESEVGLVGGAVQALAVMAGRTWPQHHGKTEGTT